MVGNMKITDSRSDKRKPCQLIRLMHSKQARKKDLQFTDSRVEKQQFSNLIKLVKEVQISDSVIGDMFLTFAKKLGQPAPVRKPAEKDQKLNNTLGRSLNFNSTLGRSIPKRQESIEESIVES